MSTTRKNGSTRLDLSHLPILGYGRISRIGARAGVGFISMPEQKRTVEELVESRGRKLYPTFLEDKDRSGGNLDREAFQEALDLLRERKIGGIAVKTLDRFSRSTLDFHEVLGEIEKLGGVLLCGDGDVTLQGGAETYMATMRIAHSAFEREQRSEYLQTSVRNALDRGVHLQSPYGYEKANGRGRPLTIHPEEGPVVRTIFKLRGEGLGWVAIARRLNDAGAPIRDYGRGRDAEGAVVRHGATWTHRTVRRIVGNEVYLGIAFNGDHRKEDAHPALVSRADFDRANRRKGTRSERKGEAMDNLLTGLCRCARCGYALAYSRKSSGYRYLRCRQAMNGSNACAGVTVPAEALEAYVEAEFAKRWLDGSIVAVPASEGVAEYGAAVEDAKARVKAALRTKADLGLLPDPDEAEVAEEVVVEARERLAAAKLAYAEAVRAEQGSDLPVALDRAAYRDAPTADRRHWLGIAFPLIVVRPADTRREPVEARVRLLDRAPAVTSSALIETAQQVAWA